MGLTFKDQKRNIFEFSNDDYVKEPLVEPERDLYLHIPAEVPGILTQEK